MSHITRLFQALRFSVVLGGVLTFGSIGTSHAGRGDDRHPQSQEKKKAGEDHGPRDNLSPKRGNSTEHRPDPCSDEHPPSNAFGLRRRCQQADSGGVARGDFNGDGFGDLAVGVPFEDLQVLQFDSRTTTSITINDAGAVNIIYGSAAGLTATGDQFWHQNSTGVLDAAEADDRFGSALASGDFNGDGFSDLAIGVPRETVGTVLEAGAVNVLYGSNAGLTAAAGNQFLAQGAGGLLDAAEAKDRFGQALNWGDFNRDGFGDLAVGIRDEDLGAITDAGAVQLIYGSAGGLDTARNQFWTQDGTDFLGSISDAAEPYDAFGHALTAGDFNGDGINDLAIGVFGENGGAGAVNVLYGTTFAGLSSASDQFWTQNTADISDDAELDDAFGHKLAAGDFNGDGFSDLAVAVPRERVSFEVDAGAVNVIYGSSAGLTAAGNQLWTQDSPGVLNSGEEGDFFAAAVAAGDFNGDGFADLAVGVPGEDIDVTFDSGVFTVEDAGAVNVIYGSSEGLRTGLFGNLLLGTTSQFWTQDSTAAFGQILEHENYFGLSLSAWNFGNGAQADLAIGIPNFEAIPTTGSTQYDSGAGAVLYGAPPGSGSINGGLSVANSQLWTQDSPGILDAAESGDRFGNALY